MATRKSGADLARWLEEAVILTGKGEIDPHEPGPVYVAVVHDGRGYNPGAAIVVGQSSREDLTDAVLNEAYDLLTAEAVKDTGYVRALEKKWGDRWQDILIEGFHGEVFTFGDPDDAAMAIGSDDRARDVISLAE